ncbi:MAG: MFS transporter [Bacillota bacterium]|nr:MFS transporter [Bacillota bacterium]
MRIDMQKPIREDNIVKLLAISAGHFMNDFYVGIIPPLLFLFKENLSLSLTQQGFIAFMFTASGTWIQPIIGYMVDRRDRTWLLTVSLVWISVWVCISSFITNYYLLLLALLLGGVSSALYHPLGSAIAIGLANRRAGTSLSVFMTVGGFAIAVSAVAALIPIRYGLDKLVYFIIPGLAVSLLMYLAKTHEIKLNQESAAAVDRTVKTPLTSSALLWVTILVVISAARNWLRISLPTYGAQLFLTKSVSPESFSLLLSIQYFAASFGNIGGGYLSDIIGTKRVLILTMVLIIACLGATVYSTGVMAMASFVLTGIFISASNSANILLTRDLLPNNATLATGLIMGLATGIGSLGVLLQGYLGDIYGIPFSFVCLFITVVVSGLLTITVPAGKKQPARDD